VSGFTCPLKQRGKGKRGGGSSEVVEKGEKKGKKKKGGGPVYCSLLDGRGEEGRKTIRSEGNTMLCAIYAPS